jgi:hypothetical protein
MIIDYLQRNPVDLIVLALQLGIHVHGHVPQVVDDAAHLLVIGFRHFFLLNSQSVRSQGPVISTFFQKFNNASCVFGLA